jgi:N-acetylglutamate synthase-like GNAT family acetyltransferase
MLHIRRYQPEDNKVVKELTRAGLAQMDPSGEVFKIPNLESDLDDIDDVYLNGGDFIVGLQDREIVAMGAFKKMTPECAEFKRLRIRPDCQRKGYGEAIMLKLMELAAGMGYKEVYLDTLATNTRAQRLFEKLGFIKMGNIKRGQFELLYYTRKLNEGGD